MKAKLALLEANPSTSQSPQPFQSKNKGLVAETFDWDEEEVYDDEEMTQVKVLMALADDELTVGKNHARNGEWIDITMRKCRDDLLVFKQAKLDVVTFQIQNTELTKLNHALQEQLKEERKVNENDWIKRHNLDSKLPNFNTGRILVPKSQAVNECLKLTEVPTKPESSKESGSKPQTPLPPLKNFQGASPSSEGVSGPVTVCDTKPVTSSVPTEIKNNEQDSKIDELTKLVQMLINEKINSTQKIQESKPVIPQSQSFKPVNPMSINHEKYTLVIVDEYSRFINTLVDEIRIDDSSGYLPDEFIHEDDPSRQYQANLDISYYITPHNRSLTKLTKDTQVPDVITPNEQNTPHTKDVEEPSGNNTKTSVSVTEPSVLEVTQSPITHHTSTSSHPAPQDRWSRDQHIELVNIIGEPTEGMLTRKALKHPGWLDTIQEELNQFYRNKVWTLVPLSEEKIAIGSKWMFRNKKDEHGTVIRNKARLVTQGYSQEERINYDETISPVERMKAIKIFLAFAKYINFIVYQMDVKSAFLNGKLKEEVYVKQPPGFENIDFPDHVCKIDKALYGLKQAPKACASVKTPMVPPNNLGPGLAGKPVNETLYRGMIGSLMYLTTSRPDIQFSTCLCARYQANPKESHLIAVKWIFRYLKGIPTLGLWYPKCLGFDLKGYSDSDYVGCNMDRKSTSGACQMIGGEDPNPPTNNSEARPLKEFIIKFTMKNGQIPLTLDYKTFCQTKGLDYNNGQYVEHPFTEEVKAELAKFKLMGHWFIRLQCLKHPFLWLGGSC
ncbi:retrovirus-related pol polyprotein from transposon TNT 1-94 [Tanacetum coccineum]|uniref:Retrovirus-related pol polyprotein from transposon TNT 1-94 n=1 Tax=Tanacetum coccineum TaxID=301880 RepID=A0ABQ5HI67_9ASTR